VSELADAIAQVPLFSLLDDQEREALATRLDRESFPKGKMIFSRGDPGDRLYVVRTGVVEIFVTNEQGDRIVLETAREGDFFGEISLLDGGARTASALAEEDVDTIVVDRGDLEEFLRIRPAAAMDLLTAAGRRLRESSRLLRNAVSRNPNVETVDNRTGVQRAADWISDFSGSLPFLFIHLVIFFVWIVDNVGPLARTAVGGWDPFPFGLLTMVVSLEAIILSVFVLLSQNRQVARDRVRNDIEYEVNVRAELEISHLHKKIDEMHEVVAKTLARVERSERK
jgi:uncharacterized membrane protein